MASTAIEGKGNRKKLLVDFWKDFEKTLEKALSKTIDGGNNLTVKDIYNIQDTYEKCLNNPKEMKGNGEEVKTYEMEMYV